MKQYDLKIHIQRRFLKYRRLMREGFQKSRKIMTSYINGPLRAYVRRVVRDVTDLKVSNRPIIPPTLFYAVFCAPLRSSITALITFHGMVSLLSRREVCFVFSTKAGPKPGSFHRSPKVAWQPIP